ncbi:acyltransferase [Burkholderia sp. Ac-20353]|uniref:acyltransferase family protein n=1 Tax=Burkholderia sp. Ac-20353 TaxID=2703894 RepID=UPI00197C1241|nr:acyltransferase [Burkholderia sp. Ac-20353]
MSGNKNTGIQALRALACALVVLQHVTYFACDANGLNYKSYLPIDLGQIGVGIFFVISGYVMGLCMHQGKAFLWNRITRIYPPYWIAIAISALIFMRPGSGWVFDLKSALLLPTSELNTTYRIPYWTLCYEMAFYSIIYILILCNASKRGAQLFCVAWLLAIAAFNIYHHNPDESAMQDWLFVAQPGKWILLSSYSAFFVFGLFISSSDPSQFKSLDPYLLVMGSISVWVIIFGIKFTFPVAYYVSTAASYSLVLIASLRASFGTILSRLGDYSYGCYLIHIAVIVAVESQLKPYAEQLGFAATWCLLLACAASVGCAYGWLEHKIHLRFTGRLLRKNRTSERATSMS